MFLSFKSRTVLINSYVVFCKFFNDCPLVFTFSNAKSLNKIEGIHKRALCVVFSHYTSPYEILLIDAGKVSMDVNRLRALCIEIYKTINRFNPAFMDRMFGLKNNNRLVREKYKINLAVPL